MASGSHHMQLVPVSVASDWVRTALIRAGATEQNARIQARHLIRAEAKGHPSHGVLRLPRLIERIKNGVADPNATGHHHWSGTAFCRVDGARGLGPVVMYSAMAALSARLEDTGVAMAAIDNCNHLGMLAHYAESAAEDGMIALLLTTSEALVHPWGARHAMIGTNPLAIGVPAAPAPFVIDLATSKISMGKIHAYAEIGQALDPGWALDCDGNPTTDAVAAKQGALAPFGDAKGYALGLAFEVLIGALTESALGTDVKGTLDSTEACNKGDVVILAKPRSSAALDRVSTYLEAIRTAAPTEAARPVRVPGDGAGARLNAHEQSGLHIPDRLAADLRRLAGV